MNQYGYALLGLTAFVVVLVSVIVYAMLRFASAARDAKRSLRETGSETAFLSAALHEAVAKLKAQEAAMTARAAASEQLSSQIVESLTAGFLLIDEEGRIEIANAAARRLLLVTGDPAGADYRVALARAPELVDLLRECLETGQAMVRREVRVPRAPALSERAERVEGPALSERTARAEGFLGVTASPLAASRRGLICLFSDLTNVIELEEQLRLKETLARLGELTAGIAHEFRNGLATIHGYSRLIDPQALPAQYRPYVEGIRQETELLGKVVTNFLNFARPEQVVLLPVDLRSVVTRAAEDLPHDFAPGTSVTVEGTFADIQGDEVLLRQVFSNLVRNAVEACEVAGIQPRIVIRGDVDRRQHVCRVVVDDNGPGIPEPARERIFQPFFTTRSRGTGLGLAIVQKIVVMHNGRVAVREAPNGGASIQLSFPAGPPS